jgi:hypothetical protein
MVLTYVLDLWLHCGSSHYSNEAVNALADSSPFDITKIVAWASTIFMVAAFKCKDKGDKDENWPK